EVLEERLGEHDGPLEVQVEYRDAAQAGEAAVLRAGELTWIASPDGSTVHVTARLTGTAAAAP
ncbi:MAG TPA: hypothetical protein VIL49_05150, partial [Capillimicrobium sp.]